MPQMQSQQQNPHPSLFHKNIPAQPDFRGIQEDVSNISRRLRTLEEGFTNLRRALQVTDQNMLAKHKMFSTEIRTVTSDIGEIKSDINEIKEKIIEMVNDLEAAAKKEEVKILEKYINFWNPLKFVTQNEVEAIVKEILNKQKK
jgi:leucyl-tRNA synthetase